MTVINVILFAILAVVFGGAFAIIAGGVFFHLLWAPARACVNEVKFLLMGRNKRQIIRSWHGVNYTPFYQRDFFFYILTFLGVGTLCLLTLWVGEIVWLLPVAAAAAVIVVVFARSAYAAIALKTMDEQGTLFKRCDCGILRRSDRKCVICKLAT